MNKGDIGTAPLWLMRGRKPVEQLVLLYLWNATLCGDKWTKKGIGEAACSSVVSQCIKVLQDEGILDQECKINTGAVVNTPEKAPDAPVSAFKYPGWVWGCLRAWKAVQGVLGPKVIYDSLKDVVEEYGEKAVIAGLERYGRATDAKYNPHPRKMAASSMRWIRKAGESAGGASFANMEDK